MITIALCWTTFNIIQLFISETGLNNTGKKRLNKQGAEPLQFLIMFIYLGEESKAFKTTVSISHHLEGKKEISHKLSFKIK